MSTPGERAYNEYRKLKPDESVWHYLSPDEQAAWESIVAAGVVNMVVAVRDNGERKVGRVEAMELLNVVVLVS